MNRYIESVGRFGVLLMMMVTMNRTEWYQNLPIYNLNNFYVWVFSLGFVLSMIWMLSPLFVFGRKHDE